MDHETVLLEARHLSKIYPGKEKPFHALHQVGFKVHQGEIFGIIGPSGAGKSTLLRCLSSMEKPSEGSVFFEGSEISTLQGNALRSIRKDMGMISQNFHLLSSRTVAENIAFPLEILGKDRNEIKKRVDELLEWVGLTDKHSIYPAFLSGGQKQRVGIARALATSPKLLFCDEATSALDTGATQQILELLDRLHKQLQLTIVLITHEMEVVRQICQRVAVISHGQIVENKRTIDIFSSPDHAATKKLLQKTPHLLPQLALPSSTCKTVRLSFRGQTAKEPVISTMIRTCQIDANILSGWLDAIQEETVGTLILELSGGKENLENAMNYLTHRNIGVEILGGP